MITSAKARYPDLPSPGKPPGSALARVVDVGNERFYPASAGVVFDALEASASRLFKVSQTDRHSRLVVFTTPMSGFSWGAHMSAQVVPAESGAYVRVAGSSRMSMNVTAKSPESKNTVLLLDAIGADLPTRPTSATGSAPETSRRVAPAGWFPDPGGTSRQRYWDGEHWTGHYWPQNEPPLSTAVEPLGTTPHARAAPKTVSVAGEPSLALMLERLTREDPRHPLDEQVEVIGETYQVKGIKKVFREHQRTITVRGVTLEELACVLVPERWNPHDTNAVAVMIGFHHVGYLPAELAADYASCLACLAATGSLATGVARAWAKDEGGGMVRARVTIMIPECEMFD